MSGRQAGSIEANGAQLHYEITGTVPAIVLIHAGIADSRMWDAQVDAFAGDHRVLRYDLRGFGRSTLPNGSYAHHQDLHVLLNALEIQRVLVIGASYGGEVALSFALEYPARVAALVLVNTLAGAADVSPGLRAGWDAMERELDAGQIDEALEVELRMWVDGAHRSPDEVDPAVRERVREMDSALLLRQLEEDAAEEIEPDRPVRERLSEVAVPTLVMAGALDMPDALSSADKLVDGIRNAEQVLIPDVAHLPSMERPDEFNRIVRDFIDRVS